MTWEDGRKVRGRNGKPRGISILEIMFAFSLLTVVIIAFATVFPSGYRLNYSNLNQNRALGIANAVAEELRNVSFTVLRQKLVDSNNKGIKPSAIRAATDLDSPPKAMNLISAKASPTAEKPIRITGESDFNQRQHELASLRHPASGRTCVVFGIRHGDRKASQIAGEAHS